MTLRRLWLGLFVLVLAGHSQSTLATAPADDSNDLAQYYGFKPLEVYKLARRSANMVAGDFNHDGLTDLVLADNSHSRLDLLQQRRKPDEKKPGEKFPFARRRQRRFTRICRIVDLKNRPSKCVEGQIWRTQTNWTSCSPSARNRDSTWE